MRKLSLSALLIMVLVVTAVLGPVGPVIAQDADSVRVFLDNTQIRFDEEPMIRNDRVLVPLRAIFEAFGSQVAWNDASQTITAYYGKVPLIFTIGSTEYMVGNTKKTTDVAPALVNSRTYVPLRVIAECYNASVYWNGDTQSVFIFSENYKPPTNIWSESEPNDSRNTANPFYLDQTAQPIFATENDVDFLKLYVHKPGIVNVTVTPGNATQIPVFKFYTEFSEIPLATSTKNAQGVESVSVSLVPGIYYIEIKNLGTVVTQDYYTVLASSAR